MAMKKETFMQLLQSYGSDFARWPSNVREDAQAFLADADPAIRACFDREVELDAFISSAGANPQISVALEEKLIASAPYPITSKQPLDLLNWIKGFGASRLASAGLICASLLGGVSVGYAQNVTSDDILEADSLLYYVSHQNSEASFASEWQSGEE
jgi:hypothetical protein